MAALAAAAAPRPSGRRLNWRGSRTYHKVFWNVKVPLLRVVSHFAVAALYERRTAVIDRRYKDQTETLPR